MSTLPDSATPAPLTVAASLTGVEGVAMLGYGVLELFNVSTERLTMGLTTALFFGGYGVFLLWAAWSMNRGGSWARSPIVLTQLLLLGMAWSFRGGETTGVAIGLLVVALIVLVGALHPASIDFLADDDGAEVD
ncbi:MULTISPECIES: hypothetical protein [unclassified Nocardioides]|uniref:hypothetical protein n=1 Tax=unclassified Nocardioides TaxID=2615069 RepID=UPI0006FA3BE9|nr:MULTISPECIES: hypothetical protein [unclassified Nocardioides]KQY54476.1 hypothetical protein ASD30_17640 [Nocardioides sp. Root140]KQZ66352.1 hypothetical protein ASD66_22720 [Nocardioides sp. Root151]KRF19552.1 hypothetical protein ASH02_23600 [Nocardioides sp. Soil796]